MVEPTSPGAEPHRLRIAGRIAAEFLLDSVQLVSRQGDLIDTLILVATVQANVAPILADPALQRAYASADEPPPPDLRRPISVNAIAGSLHLPFETVRRRVHQLAEAGHCLVTPQGVVVPEPQLTSPEHRQLLEQNLLLVRNLYRDLRLAGCIEPTAAARVEHSASHPLRAVARLSSDYALRMVDTIVGRLGDVTDGFVLLAILSANTRHLSAGREVGENGFVPDALRRPARISQVAARLGLGYELVRRRIRRLVRDGRCVAVAGGVILPSAGFLRPGMLEFMTRNEVNLRRMFAGLAQLGLPQRWEAELAA